MPQCFLVHAEEAKPLGQNGTPHNGSTRERCCHSDSVCSGHSPCPILQLQILSIHLPTGNSQFFHEGLDAHSLVILNQFGERGMSPVFPQNDIACIGLHLDQVVPAPVLAPEKTERQK